MKVVTILILMILNLHEGWDDLEDQDQRGAVSLQKGGDDLVAHKDDSIQNTIQDKIQNIHSKKYSFNRVQNIH